MSPSSQSGWQWFTNSGIGDVASILGFLLSIYIFATALKINRFLFINRRLPKYIHGIEDYASNLISLLKNYDQSVEEILDELVKCETDLKALARNVPRSRRSSINQLIKVIAGHSRKDTMNEDGVRSIYRQLLSIIQNLKNYHKDYLIER
ncbi:MAG: hypothetical protein Q8P51_13145 [Ignavibacteria bacterium]|nr:hypothetical protein [Ignavibacteria bacterium]